MIRLQIAISTILFGIECSAFTSTPSFTHLHTSTIHPTHSQNIAQDLVPKGTTGHDDDGSFSMDLFNGKVVASVALSLSLLASAFNPGAVLAADASLEQKYDGFAEYAKENQMEKSDVGCFINKCGDQTKALFSNPRGIKGISCLGRCKGEQSCASRCFAEFGSEDLNGWLSCTIEENECVKVPKNVDNSAEQIGYSSAVKNFDPSSLVGKWYKTDGLNPNYDLFDCQTNDFKIVSSGEDSSKAALDFDILFNVKRPDTSGGGHWENALTERMVIDTKNENPIRTEGAMYGLKFEENWYILGESDGKGDIPPFKLIAYKGHSSQGNYEGSFVYAKEPVLPAAAIPAVKAAAAKSGLNFDEYTKIDNTCPTEKPLNDALAGTETTTEEWVNLVVGEGGVIDWIVPGWRGEYKSK